MIKRRQNKNQDKGKGKSRDKDKKDDAHKKQNGEELIDEVPIKTQEIQMDSKETIRIPFEISEDKKRVEFVISEEDGSKMRIYSYTINREE